MNHCIGLNPLMPISHSSGCQSFPVQFQTCWVAQVINNTKQQELPKFWDRAGLKYIYVCVCVFVFMVFPAKKQMLDKLSLGRIPRGQTVPGPRVQSEPILQGPCWTSMAVFTWAKETGIGTWPWRTSRAILGPTALWPVLAMPRNLLHYKTNKFTSGRFHVKILRKMCFYDEIWKNIGY